MKVQWRKPKGLDHRLVPTVWKVQERSPKEEEEGWDPFLMEIQPEEIDWDNPALRGLSNSFKRK